jgi:hypothetical protein
MNSAETTMEVSRPGRSCPLHYRYAPSDLARAAEFHADTLYVIGGLYGNVPALDEILVMAAQEPAPATLAFNGDFNWFNKDAAAFLAINREVLRHHALRGNVETELASDDESAGCGCAYPDHVGAAEVERSNQIMLTLRDTARRHETIRRQLAARPMHLVAEVGGVRIALVHGDLESLAGWSLAQDNLTIVSQLNIIKKQILTSGCPIVASSHTCLPVALALDNANGRCAIINNGAAGMPNFRGEPYGVITRIAATPSRVHQILYGTCIDGVYVDAIAVRYDQPRWQSEFLKAWPPGSAAHQSYYQRITTGPDYAIRNAARL